MQLGLLALPWWGYVVVALVLTHITIAGVTIYLHRHQSHRALDLHAIPSHFFRFWLWLTTGMVTKEFAAIHRKHHAKVETVDDPHSPQILGIKKLLLEGTELYRAESENQETMDKYGHGTPDDWIERNLYTKYSMYGVALMMIIDLLLFGPIGLTIWAVQMLWIPVMATGVINGIGHYWGYRNFESADAAKNIVPWGIIIGGEELHNNHHAYATSAKLSNKWYEFDIGWMYIRIMEICGLATVKNQAPKIQFNSAKTECDADTLQAVITHRYDVLAKYAKSLKQMYADETAKLKLAGTSGVKDLHAMKTVKKWLHLDAADVPEQHRATLSEVLSSRKELFLAYNMRQELAALWSRSTLSKEQLVTQLQDWCHRAEASGIEALQRFSRRLRAYA
ncbi:MAG: fatty acid desaturase [Burkholderiales bacterium]